jgi:Holliday junction DNA helicase RuvA
MIARIHGHLQSLSAGHAIVRIGVLEQGALDYELLLPAFVEARLGASIGKNVSLYTFHFLESQGQGMSMIPRLAGFLTQEDLRFYLLFTTVKGIGFKRALRAMALETPQIAGAIADRDEKLLQSLPEVGKRTAETIIVTLRGKVDAFISAAAYGKGGAVAGASANAKPQAGGSLAREALEALLALGENRVQAIQWIDTAMSDPDDRPRDASELINRIYRIKAGV